MASFDEFITSLRQEFGEQGAGKKFETFCKWFLENDPEWSKTVEKVWLWDEYPNKWQRQDLGTDLIFRDKNGLIWAVQAKCYSEHRRTTKGDMNSFLADTARTTVDRRLWLQTTNKIETKAEATLKGQDKPVTIFNLDDFRNAQIDYPGSFAKLYQASAKAKPSPDPHQLRAINDVVSGLRTSDRGQMIMACGTGKTFTTLWIKEALKAEKTLVLLPSLSLLSQTMREWAWAGNNDFEILNVCSDKSVGKKAEDMNPADAPFAVTSAVDEIAKFLTNSGPRVVFCTYQSSDLIAEAQRDAGASAFDLAIADEAHRCAGRTDAGFATILDGQKIKATKRLFTTATPRYFGRAIKDASKVNDLALVDMNDKTVFGPVMHTLTFGQAIKEGLLNDYQVVIVGVDEPMVKQWIDNRKIIAISSDEITDARTLAAKIGTLKASKDYDLKRLISFHSGVLRAKRFSEEIVEIANMVEPNKRPKGKFFSDYVSGNMKTFDRKEKIEKLKTLNGFTRGILTNARCLAEGVDVPSLDCVAFIDPKGSEIDIIQAVGRAIRKVRETKAQTIGTIVIPVFIEDADDHEASIAASNFKPVWEVLKALRAHDALLAENLDQYRVNMGRGKIGNGGTFSHNVIFDFPKTVAAEFAAALRTVLVEASTSSWEFWFGVLERFKEQEGHCNVPADFIIDGIKIGQWVGTQRRNKSSLNPERKQKLNDIGFIWNPYKELWETGFEKLTLFKQIEGHCNVPLRYKLGKFSLGQWVRDQRKYRESMPSHRKKKLEDIGFDWAPLSTTWEEFYNKLIQFREHTGHCKVPARYIIDGIKLGNWVHNQRARESLLPLEQKQRLDNLGFVWNVYSYNWEDAYSKLLQFWDREGHCNVPSSYEIEGCELGKWVKAQRQNRDKISHERRERLEAIGFSFSLRKKSTSQKWGKSLDLFLKFKQQEGHCRVPAGYTIDGFNLGEWVSTQRKRKDSMPPEHQRQLEAAGFIWNVKEADWEKGFKKLLQFKQQEGHCRVPAGYTIDGYTLSTWVQTQRTARDMMAKERFNRLEAIGFIWSVNQADWENGFEHLNLFFSSNGHCKVPRRFKADDGFGLGSWVSRQRRGKLKLSPNQIRRLDDLKFDWG